jgi:hypothetical protein
VASFQSGDMSPHSKISSALSGRSCGAPPQEVAVTPTSQRSKNCGEGAAITSGDEGIAATTLADQLTIDQHFKSRFKKEEKRIDIFARVQLKRVSGLQSIICNSQNQDSNEDNPK